jgi:hypothetical protein
MNKVLLRTASCILICTLLFAAACERQPVAKQSSSAPAATPTFYTPESVPDSEAEQPDETKPPVTEAPSLLSEEELADGWIALFDGETLFGWMPATEANWRVEDGAIFVDDGEPGLLCTTTRFGDYVFKADFRSAPGTNSGIFLHTPLKPIDPASDCYELNIADSDNPFPTCSLVKRAKTAGNFDSTEWQSYEVTVSGGQVTVKLDGQQVLEYTDEKPLLRGRIGLQLNQGQIEFRNIKLKPLGMDSIFNGEDLAGWKTYPDMASKFSVTDDGLLNVQDGRGQLETARSYGDFALQLECITHAKELNSGIFFRCIPGDVMMGYESQIHNGFKNGDRRQPVDCGTGGIFRRTDARLVVADDLKWFRKTLIADGPHVATWVNGYQAADWTDERDAHENPRKGLRLEPGTIMIQGHDPTTNISFRNLRIAGLAARREVVLKR